MASGAEKHFWLRARRGKRRERLIVLLGGGGGSAAFLAAALTKILGWVRLGLFVLGGLGFGVTERLLQRPAVVGRAVTSNRP